MSAQEQEPGGETGGPTSPVEPDPVTAIADPVVIDLREGVDTVAAYEADEARRSAPSQKAN